MEELQVPHPKFAEMIDALSTAKIVDESKVKSIVQFKGEAYVICSALGNTKETIEPFEWTYVGGYRCVPIEEYSGDLEPLYYSKHFAKVREGSRERSYNGMIIDYRNQQHVIIGKEVRFWPTEEGKQEFLFET